jgi:hypothetical protein
MVPTLGIFEGQMHPTHNDNVIRFWDDGNYTLPTIGWEGHDEGDTSPNADTSAWSGTGKFTKITIEEAAKYLGMDGSDLTPETCTKQYEGAWDETHTKRTDPINTTMTTLEEEVAQLQADNNELMSRVTAVEESLATIDGSGGGDAKSTSSPYTMTKWMMLVAVITGFLFIDFS